MLSWRFARPPTHPDPDMIVVRFKRDFISQEISVVCRFLSPQIKDVTRRPDLTLLPTQLHNSSCQNTDQGKSSSMAWIGLSGDQSWIMV